MWVTITEIAEELGVSRKTVDRMLHFGGLSRGAVIKVRGQWRFDREKVISECQKKYETTTAVSRLAGKAISPRPRRRDPFHAEKPGVGGV